MCSEIQLHCQLQAKIYVLFIEKLKGNVVNSLSIFNQIVRISYFDTFICVFKFYYVNYLLTNMLIPTTKLKVNAGIMS